MYAQHLLTSGCVRQGKVHHLIKSSSEGRVELPRSLVQLKCELSTHTTNTTLGSTNGDPQKPENNERNGKTYIGGGDERDSSVVGSHTV